MGLPPGVIGRTPQPTTYRHVCWRYDDPSALHDAVAHFLAGGLAAGHQVWYVAPGSNPVGDRLRATGEFQDALRRGAARFVAVESAYGADEVVDPASQVSAYAAATEAALAAGYSGLRVAADATPLVRTPAQLDAFARYEHLVDRYMRGWPMSAMCVYDRRALGDRAIADLACLHPETNAEDVRFRLQAGALGDGHTVLAGELDISHHEVFLATLARADPRPVDGRLVVEATDLRFIDHRCLIRLYEHAHARGAESVLLRTARPALARLAALLDLPGLHVEVSR
ncbi:MEDS domain-containing protein [Micromonospora sp. WMMD882]|uniref:MEDS domain-containing protein n=1 Tax=Micromonospora sp. WMMD882 TaxID=3015151 RepID=UPI00248B8CA5|nr:MEDS domain-containing protein [Micromonospora sp. WMMD882]WBB80715.1 MEDS domain-containing protein [Micromonospora sp. WMMD882]